MARDVRGAVTGIADVYVTHMLYADDLSLTANEPGCHYMDQRWCTSTLDAQGYLCSR